MASEASAKPVEKVAIPSKKADAKARAVKKIAVLSTPPVRRSPYARGYAPENPPYPWAASLTSVTSSPRECTSSST